MEFRKGLLATAVAALAIGASFNASAASNFQKPAEVSMRNLQAELARLRAIDFQMAPVKSQADLAAYLRTIDAESPLMALSPGARDRFLDSLEFNENGLVGYRYEDLERDLTASQVYRILALFGAQQTASLLHSRIESDADRIIATDPWIPQQLEDHKNFRCLGAHNCFETPAFICMTGC